MARHHKSLRRSQMAALLLALTMLLALLAGTVSVGAQSDPTDLTIVSPEVIHTGTGPTGYEVTFRYYDPTAARVRLRGEWFFSDAAHTTTHSSAGWLPSEWIPGAFPIAYPNNSYEPNWPVHDMTLEPATGVWSFTTPLPPGTYTYGFYVNCDAAAPGLSGCTELSDPNNPPWNTSGAVEPTSQVYVPSDRKFGTEDFAWQAPNRKPGTLSDVTYPSPQSTNPVGEHFLVVYTPPGYNPNREMPYPTLYLSHGGGGNEVDWTTQGIAGRIIDNLIAAGKAQPMVVVMTNLNDLGACGLFDATCYRAEVIDNVIPYVEANYNVSHNANDRAFGGLSLGGLRANDLIFNATSSFGYFATWSIGDIGAPPVGDPLWLNPELKTRLGLHIGGGRFDWLCDSQAPYEANLTANGIPFVDDTMDGGHEWYVWRQMLYDYVSTMAFKHTTTSVSQDVAPGASQGRNVVFVTGTVKASTTEPAVPTGTVQFWVDGQKAGPAMPLLPDGTAKMAFPRLSPGEHTVTAEYSGDYFYNTSTTGLTVTR